MSYGTLHHARRTKVGRNKKGKTNLSEYIFSKRVSANLHSPVFLMFTYFGSESMVSPPPACRLFRLIHFVINSCGEKVN
jgi:hypothetical protein